MKKFAAVAVLIHVLFLLSIFHIYFQSPILQNLPVGTDGTDSPADRVVVFVADGLRAESFLKDQANRTRFLRETILSEGAFGISHTRVPTESRPGHVALFAGIYEDPSAIFKGWKENPVDFDSVFNRSYKSFCWGSPDILSIFANKAEAGKIYTDQYSSEIEDFSKGSNTSVLDLWVFDRVKQFYSHTSKRQELARENKVILFLHLLGLDTAGHVHKPYSDLFTENLILVDKGVQQIVELINDITQNDNKTTYIFTSDHGMTDRGSHGSGLAVETETPFIAWGAGIKHWNSTQNSEYSKLVIINKTAVPSWDLNQADVAPLVATLLGIAVPKNSCGKLSRQYLNVSEKYEADSMRRNAEQLLQQFYQWKHHSGQKFFKWTVSQRETDFEAFITKLNNDVLLALNTKSYKNAISLCDVLMDVTLEAIEYYQAYYQDELLFMLSLAMLGWILIVLGKLFFREHILSNVGCRHIMFGIGCLLLVFGVNYLQGTPMVVTIYFALPVFLWIPVLSKWRQYARMASWRVFGQTLLFIGFSELCVLAFFIRYVLSAFLVANSIFLIHRIRRKNAKCNFFLFILLSINLLLAIFPSLPVVEKDSNNPLLLITGSVIWTIGNIGIIVRSSENGLYRFYQCFVSVVMLINMVITIFLIETGKSIHWMNQTLSWLLLVISVIAPLLTTTAITVRLNAVIIGFSGPFMMLSLSYEPLFLSALAISLVIWTRAEDQLVSEKVQISKLFFSNHMKSYKAIDFDDFRRSTTFVMYMLVSFFGTGNMATISSFDPNWVRFFVSTFSPFLMTGLIVFKLLIPIFISVCALKSIQLITKVTAQTLFLLIFIICDLMCLHFFYLIKNKGSWLDIGSSISHFVIMECTTIVLIILYSCVNWMTEVSMVNFSFKYRGKIRYMLPYDNKSNKD